MRLLELELELGGAVALLEKVLAWIARIDPRVGGGLRLYGWTVYLKGQETSLCYRPSAAQIPYPPEGLPAQKMLQWRVQVPFEARQREGTLPSFNSRHMGYHHQAHTRDAKHMLNTLPWQANEGHSPVSTAMQPPTRHA